MKRIYIDLGKGVYLSAPCKERMTLDEWQRMTAFINSAVAGMVQSGVRVESKTIMIKQEKSF